MKARLILFSGILKLSPKEVEVLAAFVRAHHRLVDAGVKLNVFTPKVKKIVAKGLDMGNYNSLNGYIKTLKDKGVLKKIEGGYSIHPIALWQDDTITITFR